MIKRKVFVSHSWKDNETSRKLTEYLKRDSADIWIDYTIIHGGDSLPRRISEALEWCDTLILLWSKSAKDSYYVNLEWENALHLRKVIIPCMLDETNRPAILSRCLYIDFKKFDEGYRQLAYALDLVIQKEFIKKVVPAVIEKSKQEAKSHIVPSPTQRAVKPTVLFRSKPTNLSMDDVISMLEKHGFFDNNKNKHRKGFASQFKAETIEGDKVITDEASGLIWQGSGSSIFMEYEAAQKWIKDLNTKGYAGYHDWRRPTLEEAMSLVEPRKNKGLYIDPMFDNRQNTIWTCDPYEGAAGRWVIDFYGGSCFGYSINSTNYVRAVRFGQSS